MDQHRNRRRTRFELGDALRLAGAGLVLLGALAATLLALAPLWVLAAYVMLGLVSFGVYGFDKRAARNGDWRVTETALHTIDLIGGVAGGLLAQWLFRHKTRKPGFIIATALIAVGHIAAIASLLLGIWEIPAVLFVA